jgi:hypothetical protein
VEANIELENSTMTQKANPTIAKRVTRFFDSLENRFGKPEYIISDGSRAFVATEFERVLELLQDAYGEVQRPVAVSREVSRSED